ncbi:hypothetical protein F5Y07DRAFT_358480 [Xylaria sp. FL0933]|nr:hypothetical protein F5Y07DRAFT_358480 [Xylaria sp. FL0933]
MKPGNSGLVTLVCFLPSIFGPHLAIERIIVEGLSEDRFIVAFLVLIVSSEMIVDCVLRLF